MQNIPIQYPTRYIDVYLGETLRTLPEARAYSVGDTIGIDAIWYHVQGVKVECGVQIVTCVKCRTGAEAETSREWLKRNSKG